MVKYTVVFVFFILRKEETKVHFPSNQKVSKIVIRSVLVGPSYRKKKIETLIVCQVLS